MWLGRFGSVYGKSSCVLEERFVPLGMVISESMVFFVGGGGYFGSFDSLVN